MQLLPEIMRLLLRKSCLCYAIQASVLSLVVLYVSVFNRREVQILCSQNFAVLKSEQTGGISQRYYKRMRHVIQVFPSQNSTVSKSEQTGGVSQLNYTRTHHVVQAFHPQNNSISSTVSKSEQTGGVPQLQELNHHLSDPESKQYDTYVNRVQKCLDTTNLTKYFHQEDFLTKAKLNVKQYVDAIHRFIPHEFNDTLPNHCWNASVKLHIGDEEVSGQINGTKFKVYKTDIANWTLNSIPRFADNPASNQKYHFLPISCIAEVFLIGFHKCGSTYLFSQLYSHPNFYYPIRKEPSWFIGSKHDFMDTSAKQSMYFADYLVNYKSLTRRNKLKIEPALMIDGSVGMILDWPDFFEQQRIVNYCLLPSVIPQVLPRAKFVVVMRDPSSMLYSLFWYSYTMLRQEVPPRHVQLKAPTLFHDKVVEKINAINSCIKIFPLAKCLVESSRSSELLTTVLPEHGGVSIYESVYYIHIQKWLSVVPRERFLFLTLEEISTNQTYTENKLWEFLGVDSAEGVTYYINQNENVIDYQHDPDLAIRNDTKELLREFFRPYNRMLAELLGDRKFLWED